MIISINQPAYLPWPGYFDRIIKSDIHIILDHVQFEKNSLTNRNKIKTPQGWSWLTVPIQTKGRFKDCPINLIEINNQSNWRHKHWHSLLSNYSKAPFFKAHEDFFYNLYLKDWTLLNDLLNETTAYLIETFEIKTEIIKSSDLNPVSSKSDLILELCKKTDAKKYISGPIGRDYLDVKSFQEIGIDVVFHDYEYNSYQQQFGSFTPFMSSIDLLFNKGNDGKYFLESPDDCLKSN